MPSSQGSVGLARAHPLTKTPGCGAFPPDSVQLRSTLPVGALVHSGQTTFGFAKTLFNGTPGAFRFAVASARGSRSVFGSGLFMLTAVSSFGIAVERERLLLETLHHHRSFRGAGTSLFGALGITV